MYNRPDTYDETVWTSHFFRKEPKDERFDAEGLKRSSYIQYVPFEKGETMQSTIQGLQGEGQLFEKIACSYMMSVPDG
ncbi:MAG: hypothetical protein LBG59_08080 [Candidatus Peribacteria bacterium]|nr:hypothetical protein [Candidatus Peribacteria bacterium]